MEDLSTEELIAPPVPAPIGPESLEQPFPWPEVGLLVIGLAILVSFGFYVWKKKFSKVATEPSAADLALLSIDSAKSEEGGVALEALSLILRSYLNAVTGDLAIYQTVEEFRQREESLVRLPHDLREEALRLLSKMDEEKYRPSEDESRTKSTPPLVRDLIQRIDRSLQSSESK